MSSTELAASLAQAAAGVAAQLNPVESARAAAALDEAAAKLGFLPNVTPDLGALKDEVSSLVGEELTRVSEGQRALEVRHDFLVAQRGLLTGVANKAKLKETLAELERVSYELRESVKTMCRALKDNPDLGDLLSLIAEEREQLRALLEQGASDLRAAGHFRGLAGFVHAELERRRKLAAVAAREEETTREVEALAQTLKEEEERHTSESDLKRAQISVLKEKLRKMKVDTSLTLRYARKETTAKNEATGKVNSVGEGALREEIEALQRRAVVEAAVHATAAAVLKAEQEAAAKEAEEWKARHAADLAVKQATLKRETEARDAQRAELEFLQVRVAPCRRKLRSRSSDHSNRRAFFIAPPPPPSAAGPVRARHAGLCRQEGRGGRRDAGHPREGRGGHAPQDRRHAAAEDHRRDVPHRAGLPVDARPQEEEVKWAREGGVGARARVPASFLRGARAEFSLAITPTCSPSPKPLQRPHRLRWRPLQQRARCRRRRPGLRGSRARELRRRRRIPR